MKETTDNDAHEAESINYNTKNQDHELLRENECKQ